MFIYRSLEDHALIARTAREFTAMVDNKLYITLMNGYVDSKYTSIRHALEDPHIHNVCTVAEFISCTDHSTCSREYEYILRDLDRPFLPYREITRDKPCIIHTPENIFILSYPNYSELVGIAKDLLWVLSLEDNHYRYSISRQENELASIVNKSTGCVSGAFTSTTIKKVMQYLEDKHSDLFGTVIAPVDDIHSVAMRAKDWRNYAKLCVVRV